MSKRTPDIIYYVENPYETAKTSLNAVVYRPDAFHLSLMMIALKPVALRVLLYAMAKVGSDGMVELSSKEVARRLQVSQQFASLGMRNLAKYNFIRRKTRVLFWLNPAVCRPISQSIG